MESKLSANQTIQANIKNIRINWQITQKQFADAIGVSVNTVGNWERGLAVPKLQEFIKICKRFDVTADEMILSL